MNQQKRWRILMLGLMLFSIAGCATYTQQDYQNRVSDTLNQLESWPVSDQSPTDNPSNLTSLISISELDNLITQAFASNPDLQQTKLALKIAAAQRRLSDADQLPTADLTFSGSNAQESSAQYSTSLNISWELDLWQKIADSNGAAEQNFYSSTADLQAAKNSLAADIMRQWLAINLYQQYLQIQQQRLSTLDDNRAFLTDRYRQGLGSLEDLDSATTSYQSAKANFVAYQENLATAKRSLKTLLGQLDQTELPQIPAFFPDVLLSLATLPQQDLARRPDLISAYADIQSQQYTTQVAYKTMLPSISLSASLSDSARHPTESLLTSPLWSVLGQLTAPLFQGGALKATAEIEGLKTEQAFWAFQTTLLTAVNEVEDALSSEQTLTQQQEHLSLALISAFRSNTSYQDKYRKGLVEILDLLTTQQQIYDLKIELAQVTYNRLINRINLGLALGLGVTNENT